MNNINYFDTPQERRNNPLNVKWMTYLLGKTYKQTRKIDNSHRPRIEEDSKYDGEPKESDLFIHKKDD